MAFLVLKRGEKRVIGVDDWEDELPMSDYSGAETSDGEDDLEPHEAAFMEGYEESNVFEGDDRNDDDDLV